MAFLRRPPGEIPQLLDQQIPGQEKNTAHAMLPGVPARELQENNMIVNANAVHENHAQVDLQQSRPPQGLIDIREDEDMIPVDDYNHLPNQQQQSNQIQRQHLSCYDMTCWKTPFEDCGVISSFVVCLRRFWFGST